MKKKEISEYLIILGVLLYPFQNTAIAVYGSVFDLTIFTMLTAALLVTLRGAKISGNTLVWMYLFVLFQFLIFCMFNIAPFYRLMGGIIWFGGLFLIFLSRKHFSYNVNLVYKIIKINLFISVLFCFYTIAQEGLFSRPQAFFSEPSFAGLSFYSASAGLFGSAILLKTRLQSTLRTILLACIFFLGGLATLSTHIFAFLAVIFLTLTLQMSYKRLPLMLFAVVVLSLLLMWILQLEHFSSRTNFTGEIENLSLLAWLYGFDQMLYVLHTSPLLGFGLGSTGYFSFDSDYGVLMAQSNVGILNATDAYSAAFRIVIELGLPFFCLLMYFLIARVMEFKGYIKSLTHRSLNQTVPIVFLFLFSLTMTIGILMKEPTYSRSFVYIAWFFLVTCLPLNVQNVKLETR